MDGRGWMNEKIGNDEPIELAFGSWISTPSPRPCGGIPSCGLFPWPRTVGGRVGRMPNTYPFYHPHDQSFPSIYHRPFTSICPNRTGRSHPNRCNQARFSPTITLTRLAMAVGRKEGMERRISRGRVFASEPPREILWTGCVVWAGSDRIRACCALALLYLFPVGRGSGGELPSHRAKTAG